MKRFLLIPIACIVSLFSCSCGATTKFNSKNIDKPLMSIISQSLIDETTKLSNTNSVIALLLYDYIDDAIQEYFGKPTQFALYDAKITNITQIGNSFSYNVTITVPTFHGAHNPPYGLEILTFEIEPRRVTLNNYEHKNI